MLDETKTEEVFVPPVRNNPLKQKPAKDVYTGIIYDFDENGGFMAGDIHSRRTAYAYDSSPWASAARRDPLATACLMMAEENGMGIWRDAAGYREDDERRLKLLGA